MNYKKYEVGDIVMVDDWSVCEILWSSHSDLGRVYGVSPVSCGEFVSEVTESQIQRL